MIHKVYILKWIVLIAGIIFLILSIYSLIKGTKRDKLISIALLSLSIAGYFFAEIRIKNHNSKASIYFGVHQLKNYNNSTDYKIEIFPENKYLIFNYQDTIADGTWQLSVSNDNSTILLIDGRMFGVGELDIK